MYADLQQKTDLLQTIFRAEWDVHQQQGYPLGYINNPDGSIRWIFPAGQKRPLHLSLYNSAHLKAQIYKMLSRVSYKLGQKKRLWSGQFWLPEDFHSPLLFEINKLEADGYAIFTGTPGENRKSVVSIHQKGSPRYFLKVPHTPKSASNLQHEFDILQGLQQHNLRYLSISNAVFLPNLEALQISNLRQSGAREVPMLQSQHLSAISELGALTAKRQQIRVWPECQRIERDLQRISTYVVQDTSLGVAQIKRIHSGLRFIYDNLMLQDWIGVSLAHGDFTSWNCLVFPNRVAVYDWELANPSYPALFDLFHFIYQTNVLLLRSSYKRVARNIKDALASPGIQGLMYSLPQPASFYHQLYLLVNCSYYLRIYMDEPTVHAQVHWLLEMWDQALQHLHHAP
ncbi:MAG: phosphotransferase [Bacteroidota bacterium]